MTYWGGADSDGGATQLMSGSGETGKDAGREFFCLREQKLCGHVANIIRVLI
jgi:hypothetical protein